MKRHDEEDFAAFVLGQSAALFRTAFLLSGDHQRAEDLVQETLAKVYQRWSRISSMTQPGAYARKVLVNQATSWRRRRSGSELPMPTARDVRDPDYDDERAAVTITVWNAVLQLPPRQRAVVVLRFYEDLSEADTAALLGVAVGTVKSHAHAAEQRLAGLLGDTELAGAEGRSR